MERFYHPRPLLKQEGSFNLVPMRRMGTRKNEEEKNMEKLYHPRPLLK